jgi:hypothetical protein
VALHRGYAHNRNRGEASRRRKLALSPVYGQLIFSLKYGAFGHRVLNMENADIESTYRSQNNRNARPHIGDTSKCGPTIWKDAASQNG